MSDGHGVAWGNWLVSKASGLMDARLSRRSFIARTTLLGSAVAASGVAVVGCNTPPYQSITGCPPGTACTDGYTEFCCVINNGSNTCPPGTMPAGWWRADGSVYCGGGSRYYIDCNEVCCGPGLSSGFCSGCSPCRCATDCNTRKVYCNYFRYGQCNTGVAFVGPIGCRMVSCTPPYALGIGCDPSGAVDNATANHNANCAAYAPPPPPPAVLPASASAAITGGNPTVVGRGFNGSAYANEFDGTNWSGWVDLGGSMASRVVVVAQGTTLWAFAKGTDNAMWVQAKNAGGAWSGWQSLGGQFTSDPAAAVDSTGTLKVFGRGTDAGMYMASSAGGWHGWQALGGQFTTDPAVVPDASGNIWVIVRGTDNAMWTDSSAGGWNGWLPLGGQFSSDPSAAADTSGRTWVFARGTDNALWTQAGTAGSWPGWQSLGGAIIADPAAVGGSSVWVFAVGLDRAMYNRALVGGAWTPWQSLAGGFAPVRGAP